MEWMNPFRLIAGSGKSAGGITAAIALTIVTLASGSRADTPSGASSAPIPDIRQLMTEVMDHQKALEKVRENYTYRTATVTQEIDSNGKVTKTESEESEVFFVNTHRIERTVKIGGKPLSGHEKEKEQER